MNISNIIQDVKLDKIKVEEKNRIRSVSGKNVIKLKESIEKIGLIHPIIINHDYRLIAGFRRISAIKELGYKTIPAIIKNGLSKLEELDIEIEENWRRKSLTSYEMDLALARRKELYDELHPEVTKEGSYKKQHRDINGRFNNEISDLDNMTNSEKNDKIRKSHSKNGNENSHTVKRFTKVTADLLSISERTVQRRVRVGKAIRENKLDGDIIEKYQKGKIPHTVVLKKVKESDTIKKKNKKGSINNTTTINSAKNQGSSQDTLCKNCKKAKASTCPCCGEMVIICDKGYFVLKEKNTIACEEYDM